MSKRKRARFQRAAYQQFLQAGRERGESHLRGCLEAIVFAAPKPVTLRDLARTTGGRRRDIEKLLAELRLAYHERGIQLVESPEGWTFMTHPSFGPEVRAITGKRPVRMSKAQLETIAVIAYRQPVTRPEIDEVRGVDSGPVLRTLLDRDLIRVLGKKEEPGRPLLYGTTDEFLKLVNLSTISDLPTLREFTELSDDSRDTYERKMGERAPAGAIEFDDLPDEPIDPTQPLPDEQSESEGDPLADVPPLSEEVNADESADSSGEEDDLEEVETVHEPDPLDDDDDEDFNEAETVDEPPEEAADDEIEDSDTETGPPDDDRGLEGRA